MQRQLFLYGNVANWAAVDFYAAIKGRFSLQILKIIHELKQPGMRKLASTETNILHNKADLCLHTKKIENLLFIRDVLQCYEQEEDSDEIIRKLSESVEIKRLRIDHIQPLSTNRQREED